MDILLNKENIEEGNILTGSKNVPEIWYKDVTGKKRRHFVDIYIPKQNKCIEVKSTWTMETQKNIVFLKQEEGKKLGYDYEIWVIDKNGGILQKYI